MFSIKGKRYILTGVTGHLGYPIGLELLRNGAELIAIVRDKSPKEKIETLTKMGAEIYNVDLSDINQIDSFFLDIESTTVDGLINNANFMASSSLDNADINAIRKTMEGTFGIQSYIIQKSIPFLKRSKGSILNIGSMYGIVSPDPDAYKNTPQFNNPPFYGAAKAGLIQLTKYAACYLAQYEIRVNSISPGPFPKEEVQLEKAFIDELKSRVPLGRIGQPKELVGPVIFILSDGASFITGHNLVVDGGWTAW